MSPEERKLDEFLDDALKAYSHADTPLGFESRVLARLWATPSKPMSFKPAYAAAATVILAAALYGTWQVASPDGPGVASPPAIALRLPAPDLPTQRRCDGLAVKQTLAPGASRHQASVVHTRYFVKQPLSEQEKLLLAFARENPKEILSTVEWQKHMRQPPEEQTPPDQGER